MYKTEKVINPFANIANVYVVLKHIGMSVEHCNTYSLDNLILYSFIASQTYYLCFMQFLYLQQNCKGHNKAFRSVLLCKSKTQF